MTFLSGCMAVLGIISYAISIFGLICKLNPKLLKDETIRNIYDFLVGTETDVEVRSA